MNLYYTSIITNDWSFTGIICLSKTFIEVRLLQLLPIKLQPVKVNAPIHYDIEICIHMALSHQVSVNNTTPEKNTNMTISFNNTNSRGVSGTLTTGVCEKNTPQERGNFRSQDV